MKTLIFTFLTLLSSTNHAKPHDTYQDTYATVTFYLCGSAIGYFYGKVSRMVDAPGIVDQDTVLLISAINSAGLSLKYDIGKAMGFTCSKGNNHD